tara:strand:+ start:1178 stop:1825 length:648 start_codon:yes stop_codon:yes gene_type:complete
VKTLHNTKNCNYRRFLHKRLKDGIISGKFYKFLCRNFPYRLTYYAVDMKVREVMRGKINESTAINTLKEKEKDEIKRQAEMYKSNIECRNKISEKKTAKKFTTEEDVGRDIASGEFMHEFEKALAKIESKEFLEVIKGQFNANKISRKVLDHAVVFIKKCMKKNFYLPMKFKTLLHRLYNNKGYNIHAREAEFFIYLTNAFSKTHKYSLYKQKIK